MNRILFTFVLMALAAGQGGALAATETNKPSNSLDYNSFKIISDRNIFNASRSGRRKATAVRRQPKIDTFVLRGTLSYEKGQHAIFDIGSKQSDLKLGAEINGYRIALISFDHVILKPANGEMIKLPIGSQMRREDDGPWTLSGRAEASTSTVSSSSTSSSTDKPAETPATGGSDDDIVRRLMEKRKQQLKK